MTTISINGDSRHIADAEPQWIATTINNLRENNQVVCLQVHVHTDDCQAGFVSLGCGPGGPGSPPRNPKVAAILELWIKHRLNTDEFNGGNVQAFLAQLRQLL